MGGLRGGDHPTVDPLGLVFLCLHRFETHRTIRTGKENIKKTGRIRIYFDVQMLKTKQNKKTHSKLNTCK